MMNFKAAILAVITLVAAVAAYVVASFQMAYPEGGSIGWLMVAAIFVVWAIMCGLILRTRGER